jgi:xanthine dehydrogenase accessory factor
MKEREQILLLYRAMREEASAGVLVTVVKTLGSSYRRPGARLLITESGKRAGSISGGCLEDDVVKKAWWLTEKGPVVRRYDTTPDGEIGPMGETGGGFGLGCNGIIYLLLDRVRFDEASPLAILERVHATRQPAFLEHVLQPPVLVGSFAAEARLSEQEAFFETLLPPVRYLGWHVSVFDGRAHYARRERFPHAQEVATHNSADNLDSLQIDSRTVAVVMTHSYSQDLNFLRHLAQTPLAYLGVLGPRNRSMQMLIDAGIEPGHVPALHGPVGLDIGADGPEQVALSIIAEIQASMNGRDGGSLRTRIGSIHSRESDGQTSARFVPSIVCA